MIVTTEVVQKSKVTIELELDEAQWLRDILGLVSGPHEPSYRLFGFLDESPEVIGCADEDKGNEGSSGRGFSGTIRFEEPT